MFAVTPSGFTFCVYWAPHIQICVTQLNYDSQDPMIVCFHVSWYVCQIQMGGLWSSYRLKLAPEKKGWGRKKEGRGEK